MKDGDGVKLKMRIYRMAAAPPQPRLVNFLRISWEDPVRLFSPVPARATGRLGNGQPDPDAPARRLGIGTGVHGLVPGVAYRLVQPVKDCYHNVAPVGMDLLFPRRGYLPHHGGHPIVLQEPSMYLQDDAHANVLNSLDACLTMGQRRFQTNSTAHVKKNRVR